jgi:hypothetical protein
MTPNKPRRRTSAEVIEAKTLAELSEIRQRLGEVQGLARFLLASRLVQAGHAKDLHAAAVLIKDKARLDAILGGGGTE